MSAPAYSDFATRALKLYKPPTRRPATYCKLKQVLGEFKALCETTDDIDLDAIASWLAAYPDRAPLTSFSLLRSFARAVKLATKQRAGDRQLVQVNPFEAMPAPQWFATGALEAPERVRHLTAGQIARMLTVSAQEAKGGDWAALRRDWLVNVYAFTGCRAKEAQGLLVDDIDLAREVIVIRPNERRPLKTKASARRLPMAPTLVGKARIWLPLCESIWASPHKGLDGPWLSGRPGAKPLDEIKALGVRAGVPNATILSIRHGFATAIEQLSGELLRQRWLGHRQRKTQYGYGHEDLDQLRQLASRLRYD